MRLLIIRHAEPEFGWGEDPPLTATGRQQAACLARAVRGADLDRVVASTMRRAVETATPLAASLGLPLITEPDLVEIGMGELGPWGPREQAEWEQVTARWHQGDFSTGPRGGEALASVIARVVPVARRLVADHCEHGLAIVAHGVVNGVIIPTLCPELRPELGRYLPHDHAGVWELEGDGSGFRVVRRNDIAHLADAR